MATREDIREGLAKALYEREFSKDYWDTRMSNGDKVQWFAKADCGIQYLHSQGVVIKVDRKLPDHGVLQTGNYRAGQRSMIDAGYIAVEPLI